MLLNLENTQHLVTSDFIETFSIQMYEEENCEILTNPSLDIPKYFYVTAYILEFDTEYQMQGLFTLLTNSSTYNFENALRSFNEIGSIELVDCLTSILSTLRKYDMTPIKMRELFIEGTKELPESSVITTGIYFNNENLKDEISKLDNKLYEIYNSFYPYLEKYLIEKRGK